MREGELIIKNFNAKLLRNLWISSYFAKRTSIRPFVEFNFLSLPKLLLPAKLWFGFGSDPLFPVSVSISIDSHEQRKTKILSPKGQLYASPLCYYV